ncbi:MAG: hypothetical protein HY961_17465 [Ignavibacteriae bacterium]|nr:hypothetical protein [Ignavibacteriota bacterium]
MSGKYVLAFLLVLTVSSCDEGIKPPPFTGFSGVIRYRNWPPADSLRDLRIVAFRNFPPRSIFEEVLNGRAVVYPGLLDTFALPLYVDSMKYHIEAPLGRFEYIAVAQQYGPNIFTDWRPVGQYDLDTNLAVPSPIEIKQDVETQDIDINVDFQNPPPRPFAE